MTSASMPDWAGEHADDEIVPRDIRFDIAGNAERHWFGGDPLRYRALMPVGVLAKLSFAIPALTLFALGRLDAVTAVPVSMDVLLAVGFVVAWRRTS